MNGAKDTAENTSKSAFPDDGFIKSDLESIMHRRCIVFQVNIGGEIQAVTIINTQEDHIASMSK